ncbi:hypothetical protein MMC28_010687 [Mycoblastus sanguinarius]|nr:hypothetical protein [Mycoblastus sanguinarius]
MPGFLDFIFPFGRQEHARDFHFSGFRYQTRLPDAERGLQVPELGWSGRDYKLCYNLKSVERSQGGGEPWSIRQAAIHHSFDVETGQASWVAIKANQLLQNRIKSATGSRGLPQVRSFQSLDRSFASTLATHLIFSEWSGENWRWYINFLEESFQDTTRRALSPIVRTPTSPIPDIDRSPTRQHTQAHKGLELSKGPPAMEPPQPPPPTNSILPGFHSMADGMIEPPQSPYGPGRPAGKEKQQEFSFTDLQRIQDIEEKANAAMLILKSNITVLTELKQYYRTIAAFQGWPSELTSHCKGDVLRFEQHLTSIENDLQMQHSRIETLLRLIADRKSLVECLDHFASQKANMTKLYGILDSQNTGNMQRMTADMHEIAIKTKQETISMRIITFVTLCFLPGTFISVGVFLVCCSMKRQNIVNPGSRHS